MNYFLPLGKVITTQTENPSITQSKAQKHKHLNYQHLITNIQLYTEKIRKNFPKNKYLHENLAS